MLSRAGVEARGYSVLELLEETGRTRAVSPELLDLARKLDKAYISTRYPDAHQSGSPGGLYTRAEPVKRAVLFGSWAAGRATAFSDVDVLVIYADPPRDDAYRLVWDALRVPGLEPHVYAESEAEPVRATLDRMLDGGVELLP